MHSYPGTPCGELFGTALVTTQADGGLTAWKEYRPHPCIRTCTAWIVSLLSGASKKCSTNIPERLTHHCISFSKVRMAPVSSKCYGVSRQATSPGPAFL